jgi:catalase
MGDIPKEIKYRHILNCYKADPDYGQGVADALGIPLKEVPGIK